MYKVLLSFSLLPFIIASKVYGASFQCSENLRSALFSELSQHPDTLNIFQQLENLKQQIEQEIDASYDNSWRPDCSKFDELCDLEGSVALRIQNHFNRLARTDVRVTTTNFRSSAFYGLEVSGVLNGQTLPKYFYVLVYSSANLPGRDATYQFAFRRMHENQLGLEYFGFISIKADELGLAFVRLPGALKLVDGVDENFNVSLPLRENREGWERLQLLQLKPDLEKAFDIIDEAGLYEIVWNVFVNPRDRIFFVPGTFQIYLGRRAFLEERASFLQSEEAP